MSLVLGIESSCDDTAAAVFSSRDRRLLSNVLASQVPLHAPYGGVVPELASRAHFENLPRVVEAALREAGITGFDLGRVAVTAGPGLLGSLLVGVSFAKGFAWGFDLPLVKVNHVEAHLRSPWIERPDLPYPSLALSVSGGHSHLFLCKSPVEASLVARTRDDAAGEALDKLAKALNLPYPGGPVIDRLSERGDPKAVPFTLPRMAGGSLDYSFSGLKTAAIHHMKTKGLVPVSRPDPDDLPRWEYDLLASFQKRVVDHLLQRMRKAALLFKPRSMVVAGGVACNRLLRQRLLALGEELEIPAAFPSPALCTDNAAMVAFKALDSEPEPDGGLALDAFPTYRWPSASPASPPL